MDNAGNNTIDGNEFTGNAEFGIFLYGTDCNNVTGNWCHDNPGDAAGPGPLMYAGIGLNYSHSNRLAWNNCSANDKTGIWFLESSDNLVYGNELTNNGILHVLCDQSPANAWDNGSVGNYWGNYTTRYPAATPVPGTNVWNTPYAIYNTTTQADRYPLMVQPDTDATPTVTFSVNTTSIKAGQSVQFMAAATGGNPPFTYQWNFGDGTPNATDTNPAHQFMTPGYRTVNLTVRDNDGDLAFASRLIVVGAYAPLTASFTTNATRVQHDQDVQFTDQTTGGVPPYAYQWNFGDLSSNVTQVNPVHQFGTEGNFTVVLTVQDSFGNVSIHAQVIEVTGETTSGANGTTPPGSDDELAIPGVPVSCVGFFGLVAIVVTARCYQRRRRPRRGRR